MSSLILHSSLQDTLGFAPGEGDIRMVSPDNADIQVESRISLDQGRLEIQTRAMEVGAIDMLRLVLIEQTDGWQIHEQVHSGLAVAPDAKLALSALEQNLCAAPLPVTSPRKSPRP